MLQLGALVNEDEIPESAQEAVFGVGFTPLTMVALL